MTSAGPLRTQLAQAFGWRDAHADFEAAVRGLPVDLRGATPPGLPYSPWQLLEHLRRTQADILAYCTQAEYHEPKWPDDYWPPTAAPQKDQAWDESVAAFLRDRKALERLVTDPGTDLLTHVPSAAHHTFLREILVVLDHNSYHVGQLIAVRRLLGAWSP